MKGKVILVVAVALIAASPVWALSIVNSKHDLSSESDEDVHSNVNEICVFCHTPHSANQTIAPLWNRSQSTSTFTPYTSSTLDVEVSAPTGSSLACLSCHDGSIALDQLANFSLSGPGTAYTAGTITFTSDTNRLTNEKLDADAPGYMGTSLTDDHPVSLDEVELVGSGGTMECSTCHDAHDDQYGAFLVMDNSPASGTGSPLCLACHIK